MTYVLGPWTFIISAILDLVPPLCLPSTLINLIRLTCFYLSPRLLVDLKPPLFFLCRIASVLRGHLCFVLDEVLIYGTMVVGGGTETGRRSCCSELMKFVDRGSSLLMEDMES